MTSNPFEKHGIDHLSPSSLRLFRECPAVWCGKYLLRATDEVGPGAWRGRAVEAGVDRLVFGDTIEFATKAMQATWDELAQGLIEPDVEKEQLALAGFLEQGRLAFANLPVPLQRQGKMSLSLPGIPVPLVGFCDYLWKDTGTDLKTTWRMPGTPDPEHVMQVACYSMHYGVDFTLTYLTPKRWTRYELLKPELAEAWDRIIEAAHAVQSFLAHADSAIDALSMISPDYSSFYFKPPMIEAVRAAKAVRVLSR